MTSNKQYLGDGVFIDFDGYQLVLTTEDGYSTTNTIYLEPIVYQQVVNYWNRLHQPPAPDAAQQEERDESR